MIKRIIQWFKENKAWKNEHIIAWEEYKKPDNNGISKFQNECLNTFRRTIQAEGINTSGNNEKYFSGKIRGTNINFFIYTDGAELNGLNYEMRFEEWDFKTPLELITQFTEQCKELKQFNNSLKRDTA